MTNDLSLAARRAVKGKGQAGEYKEVQIAQVTVVSIILVVPANHPAKSLKEWVAWAKAQNRPINGAVSTRGASVDITMQAFMKVAGISGQTIPFRGGAIRGIGAPKDTPGAVIDYLEAATKKIAADPEFHQIMKDIVHPVLHQERKGFLKNMQDGFDMYGKLIKELNLKME